MAESFRTLEHMVVATNKGNSIYACVCIYIYKDMPNTLALIHALQSTLACSSLCFM